MAITKNIFIDQGATYQLTVTAYDQTGSALSITSGSGCTASGKLSKSFYSSSKVSFAASITGTGQVSLALGATTTAALTPGVYVYDAEILTPTGIVYRVVQGNATVDPNVTT
jgi:hypothetical protein